MSSSGDDVPLANGTMSNGVNSNREYLFSLLSLLLSVDLALEALNAPAASNYTLHFTTTSFLPHIIVRNSILHTRHLLIVFEWN